MSKRFKYKRMPTPEGMLLFPRLITPDTKFVSEGEYNTKLALRADSKKTKKFICAGHKWDKYL